MKWPGICGSGWDRPKIFGSWSSLVSTWVGPRKHVLDAGIYGRHLANMIKQCMLSSDEGCHYHARKNAKFADTLLSI